MSRRDEEKKRRRQKRLAKRRERPTSGYLEFPCSEGPEDLDDAFQAMEMIEEQMQGGAPATWPGGCDPSLARPDRVKYMLATFVSERQPGAAKMDELEQRLDKGLLGGLPELDHWSWEEFLWHGLPGDSWEAVEFFLEHAGARFPPAAQDQIRLWKQARIGVFQVGEVANDTVSLHEWDPVRGARVGPPFRAITLNVGGVNAQRSVRGQFLMTHVAPWRPEDELYCGMGYASVIDSSQLMFAAAYLGLRHLDVAATPLPWKQSKASRNEYLYRWRLREWHSWLEDRLQFPFLAFVPVPPRGEFVVREVRSLLPSTPEQARMMGIYLEVQIPGQTGVLASGGTGVTPVDITSPNRLALAEYHAYRELAGPPPGTQGMPKFTKLR